VPYATRGASAPGSPPASLRRCSAPASPARSPSSSAPAKLTGERFFTSLILGIYEYRPWGSEMENSWIEAARRYDTFDERTRADYWSRLNPEQQNLLVQALATLTAESRAAAASRVQAPVQTAVVGAPRPRSLFGRLAIGCGWMFLGGVLTVALEIVAVSAGISAISSFFSVPCSSYSTLEAPTPSSPDYLNMDCSSLQSDSVQYLECTVTQKVWREQQEHNQEILHGESDSH